MRSVIASISAIAAVCLASPSIAEEAAPRQCAGYQNIAANLFEKYHEAPVSEALVSPKDGGEVEVLIVFASPHGATWTIIVADSKGQKGCILATGEQWVSMHVLPPRRTGPGI